MPRRSTRSPTSNGTIVEPVIGESQKMAEKRRSQRTYITEIQPEYYKRVGASDDPVTKLIGAASLLFLWGVWIGGSFSPFWWTYLLLKRHYVASALSGAILIGPFIFRVNKNAYLIRFVLAGAGWFKQGTCLYVEPSIKAVDCSQNVLLCQHPHGLFSFGFLQNGSAARINAGTRYMPDAFSHLRRSGQALIEPLLFKVPLIRAFVCAMGVARPATREWTKRLMAETMPLGLLPGGSEEIIISKHGHERVYISKRKGFIKYALQYGYTLLLAYTFGEADSYHTSDFGQNTRMWMLHKLKVPTFFAWGTWWCPLLPRSEVPLETVIGNPIRLPKTDNPSSDEVDKYHALYIENLVELFNRNKARFGYSDRELEIY